MRRRQKKAIAPKKRTGLDIGIYGAFMLYAATAVVTPMSLLEMAKEFHFSLTGGGGLEISRSFLILLTLLFSGYAAARWGKIRMLAIGLIWISFGLILYSLSSSYVMVIGAMAFVGVGGGFVEALINPLVQDIHPEDAPHHLNVANAFFSIGVFVTVLGAGELLTEGFSWRVLFVILGIIGIVLTAVFLLSGRGVKLPGSQHSLFHVHQILSETRFWLLGAALFIGGALESAFTFWSASYIQIHFDALPRGAGFGTAAFAAGMAIGRLSVAKLTRYLPLNRIIMLSAVLGLVLGVLAYMISGLSVFFVLLFGAGLSVACYWPTIQSWGSQLLDVDDTLLFIYLSCFGIPGFGLTPIIMGAMGDAWDLRTAFMLVPVLCLLMIIVISIIGRQSAAAPASTEAAADAGI